MLARGLNCDLPTALGVTALSLSKCLCNLSSHPNSFHHCKMLASPARKEWRVTTGSRLSYRYGNDRPPTRQKVQYTNNYYYTVVLQYNGNSNTTDILFHLMLHTNHKCRSTNLYFCKHSLLDDIIQTLICER